MRLPSSIRVSSFAFVLLVLALAGCSREVVGPNGEPLGADAALCADAAPESTAVLRVGLEVDGEFREIHEGDTLRDADLVNLVVEYRDAQVGQWLYGQVYGAEPHQFDEAGGSEHEIESACGGSLVFPVFDGDPMCHPSDTRFAPGILCPFEAREAHILALAVECDADDGWECIDDAATAFTGTSGEVARYDIAIHLVP
jgi:hypothetical protein